MRDYDALVDCTVSRLERIISEAMENCEHHKYENFADFLKVCVDRAATIWDVVE